MSRSTVMFSIVCCRLHVPHEWQSKIQEIPVKRMIEVRMCLILLILKEIINKFIGDKNNYLFENTKKKACKRNIFIFSAYIIC